MCVSPFSGHADVRQLAEWRIHHASLGFERVYWYERDSTGASALKPLIDHWNTAMGYSDVLQPAPYLHPVDADDAAATAYADQASTPSERSFC